MLGKIILICHDNNRSLIYKGRLYSQLLDSINDYLTKRNYLTITIPKPYTKYNKNDIYGNVKIYDRYFKLAGIISNIIRYLPYLKVFKFKLKIYIWQNIFKAHKPLFIICIQPWEEMCIAAKNLDIEMFDLQHGVLEDSHYYGKNHRSHKNNKGEYDGWPTSILCWDNASKEWIKQNCEEIKNSYVIGQPFLERFIAKCENDDLVKESKIEFINNKKYRILKDKKRKTVLFTEQWIDVKTINKCKIGIPDNIKKIINESKINVFWLLRIHPVTIKRYGEKTVFNKLSKVFNNNPNVEWEFATKSLLPLILEVTDLHVTKNSSTIKEAAYLGISSAIIDNDNPKINEWYRNEIDEGYAEVVNSREELEYFIINKTKDARKIFNKNEKDVARILNKYCDAG